MLVNAYQRVTNNYSSFASDISLIFLVKSLLFVLLIYQEFHQISSHIVQMNLVILTLSPFQTCKKLQAASMQAMLAEFFGENCGHF
jgi:hypothetical protein